VRNKFAEKLKHSLYGRRDAVVKTNDASVNHGRQSNCEDNIARLLAAATSAELALLKHSPDSKKPSRDFSQ